jgi:hypothetical protein
MNLRKIIGLGLVAAAALTFVQPAQAAYIYSFTEITNNSSIDVSGQLAVEVTDAGAGQVAFTFTNSGPLASSITDVYFDDGTLLGIASVTNGTGVDFSQGASPGELPGGSAISFQTTAGFSADSNPPTQPMGVNPGETLTITFNLINGMTFADTIAAIEQATGDGSLRIGLHVQGLSDGQSESYVNKVPDGGTTMSLLGFGLAAIGAYARRRSSR